MNEVDIEGPVCPPLLMRGRHVWLGTHCTRAASARGVEKEKNVHENRISSDRDLVAVRASSPRRGEVQDYGANEILLARKTGRGR